MLVGPEQDRKLLICRVGAHDSVSSKVSDSDSVSSKVKAVAVAVVVFVEQFKGQGCRYSDAGCSTKSRAIGGFIYMGVYWVAWCENTYLEAC